MYLLKGPSDLGPADLGVASLWIRAAKVMREESLQRQSVAVLLARSASREITRFLF